MKGFVQNNILVETVSGIKKILKDEYYSLTVERAVIGLFFSGVKLSSGHGGLCFTPIKEIPMAVCCPSSAELCLFQGSFQEGKFQTT